MNEACHNSKHSTCKLCACSFYGGNQILERSSPLVPDFFMGYFLYSLPAVLNLRTSCRRTSKVFKRRPRNMHGHTTVYMWLPRDVSFRWMHFFSAELFTPHLRCQTTRAQHSLPIFPVKGLRNTSSAAVYVMST